MSYKSYRKSLYVLLLILLAIIGSLAKVEYNSLQKQGSALSFSDAEAASIEDFDKIEKGTDVVNDSSGRLVVPCGDPIGIYVKSKGVMVIASGEITDKEGRSMAPCNNILLPGDYILGVNGKSIEDKNSLIDMIKNCDGKAVDIKVSRGGNVKMLNVLPVDTEKGYMLGVWVKDDISGIGTLTYIDEKGFGALGHSINDNDTGKLFEISDGALYKARIVNIVKPSEGKPGKLEGVIDYSKNNIIGRIRGNTLSGVNGYLTKYGAKSLESVEWVKVAEENEISLGEAYLLSAVSGEKEYYKVEIVDIDVAGDNNRNIELKVVDDRLLKLTGGIVQGLFTSYNGYNTRKNPVKSRVCGFIICS